MPFGWIDIHAHLDRLKETDLAAILAEAGRANVSTIISTSTDLTGAATVVRQCQTNAALYGAVGISPFDVASLPDNWEVLLRDFSLCPRIIAIGEIGLDDSNSRRYPPLAAQLPVFEKQLELALSRNLPAIVHSRGAEKRVAEICNSLGVKKVVFHCFTGDPDALKAVLDYGYDVSFSGIITFSPGVRDLVSQVPVARLFIETDTPYLSPLPHYRETNCPARVRFVGETVAACKGIAPSELQRALARNFERLFRARLSGASEPAS